MAEITGVECENFHLPVLPITCGPSEKCIQNAQGQWVTPQEFEAEGQRGKSKRWRRSLRCRGQTLEHLLEGPDWKECEVCRGQGELLGCASCDRAFHRDCHIPAVGADRKLWSCTFCRMKEYSGNQQHLGKSQAPARQMEPEVQLKCELLLLKAYCHPQGSFFAGTPHNIRDYGEPFKEAMWLNLVKERLAEKVYTVSWFVRDMRLIFRNHREFHKDSDLGDVGLDLETEFEKNLKETLTLHGASENGFRVP
ncbi:sp110 nuclear body protein-like [Sorex fumeus]|uniref:sp110 nuclear body protein-like n=1 Tax=Sorex fumeus TaxID=62283 RepID=UPI0024AC8C81|nr:sp110 nuclear body protein-like [Sorex fumeus]